MTIAGDAIEAIAPQLRVARWGVIAGIAAIALAAICFAAWWLIIRPANARADAAQAHVQAATSAGTAAAAQDTLKIVVAHDGIAAAIDALTRENDHAIHAAPGATESVGADLDRAGRAALCLRRAYQSDPGCAALRGDGGGVGPAQPDAGGGPAQ
jgi:type II secretory pathway component PulM